MGDGSERVDASRPAEIRAELASVEKVLSSARPDVVGHVTAFHDDGTATTVVYFSSEAEARANEGNPMLPEAEASGS